MAMSINTNVLALNAQRNLSSTQSSLGSAMERLSSGLRINSAKDDAAGLAISDRMTSQIRGLNQAVRNAGDGISMAQTAEGAMQEMTNILQRMREISVQSVNDTNTQADRLALQDEVDQLYSELDRIAGTTQFNGKNILDGSAGSSTFQVGANSGQTLSFEISSVTTKSLALNSTSGVGELNGGRVGAAANAAAGSVASSEIGLGIDFGAGNGVIEDDSVLINGEAAFASNTTFTGVDDAADVVTAINSNTGKHGVTASAYNNVSGNALASGVTLQASIEGVDVSAGSAQELVDVINRDVAGVTAALNSKSELVLSNDTGNDIAIANHSGTSTNSIGISNATYTGYVSLTSNDGSDIKIAANTENTTTGVGGGLRAIQAMGLNVSNGAGEATGRAVSSAAITEANSLQINGIEIGASASASASDKAAAINAVKDKTGVEATGFTQLTVDLDLTSVAGADEQIVINGSTIDLDSTQGSGGTQFDRLDQVVTAINAAGLSGVVASANDDGKLLLTSDTGQTITIADEDGNIGAVVDQSGNSTADVGTAASGATVALGNITLKSTNGGDVKVSGSEADAIGFTAQGGNEEAIGSGLSVTSAANASNSIERIDGALAKIDKSRSELGAVQNRFESTISNLQNVSQNLSAARSRIQDADFAQETTNLSRAQILSQAGTSMLAQANASKQNLLSLLG